MSLISRIAGIVRRPRSTFERVAVAPRWAGLLTLLYLVSFGVSAAFVATDIGQQALVDQWERTAVAFGQPVDDARYREFQELSRQGVAYATLTSLASGPAAAIGLAALLFGAFSAAGRGAVSYRQVLAAVAHADVILALRNVIAAPLNYARESIASPLTLVRFASGLDEGSPIARFLSLIDVFVLWWVLVLAIGMAVLYRRRTRRVAALFIGVYLAVALVLAGAMAVLGGTT